ncbi:hypothetical protein [Planktosalinus lacus]|nr:hypothetical protein [Planktosalinus lacus]
MPNEISFLYLFFIVPRNVYLVLGGSAVILLLGEWLRGLRSLEKGRLRIFPDKMIIETPSKKWDLSYNQIHKIKGSSNIMHNYRELTYMLLLLDGSKIEIRTSKEIFNELTDHFPDKV